MCPVLCVCASPAACLLQQLEGMLSPFGELKDCVVIVEKMTQKSKVRPKLKCVQHGDAWKSLDVASSFACQANPYDSELKTCTRNHDYFLSSVHLHPVMRGILHETVGLRQPFSSSSSVLPGRHTDRFMLPVRKLLSDSPWKVVDAASGFPQQVDGGVLTAAHVYLPAGLWLL